MKKLLIILIILSLLLNAFLISKPYLMPDNEKETLQNSLDSCLVVNDSLEGELIKYDDFFVFNLSGVTASVLEEYHINQKIELFAHIIAADSYINESYFEYQIITQQQHDNNPTDSLNDVYNPKEFFIDSIMRDTVYNSINWVSITFKPVNLGQYYLRGHMHVPTNNGKYHIFPLEAEINVVP